MKRRALALFSCACLVPPATVDAQSTCTTEWRLTETLRIGSIDGPDALSEVRSLSISPAGELYVAQFLEGALTVFAADGMFLRTFGREGQGPGEFESAPTSATWRGDTLWVGDLFRAQSFDRDGRPDKFVRFTTSYPEESSRYTPGLPFSDGSFSGHRWLSPQLGPLPYGPETESVSVRRFSATGDVLGVIATVEVGDWFVRYDDRPSYREHPMWELLPGSSFAELEQNIVADRSAVVLLGRVDPASFEGIRIALSGDTLSRWSVAYDPIPVSRTHAAWLGDQFASAMAGDFTEGRPGWFTASPASRNRMRAAVEENFWTPRYHPPVRQIIAGADDTIWLLRELLEPGGADRWEVYGYDGGLQGRVRIGEGRSQFSPWAPRMRVLRASRDDVWGTTIDEYDVPYIHRWGVSNSCR